MRRMCCAWVLPGWVLNIAPCTLHHLHSTYVPRAQPPLPCPPRLQVCIALGCGLVWRFSEHPLWQVGRHAAADRHRSPRRRRHDWVRRTRCGHALAARDGNLCLLGSLPTGAGCSTANPARRMPLLPPPVASLSRCNVQQQAACLRWTNRQWSLPALSLPLPAPCSYNVIIADVLVGSAPAYNGMLPSVLGR